MNLRGQIDAGRPQAAYSVSVLTYPCRSSSWHGACLGICTHKNKDPRYDDRIWG